MANALVFRTIVDESTEHQLLLSSTSTHKLDKVSAYLV